MWNLIGKYHSHYLPIRDILFDFTSDSVASRFFLLGEDRKHIKYDLAHKLYRKLHCYSWKLHQRCDLMEFK